MPIFYTDTELDIDVHEFLSECSKLEINELIKSLKQDGYLGELKSINEMSIGEREYVESCEKLSRLYHRLPNSECDVIKNISNKY